MIYKKQAREKLKSEQNTASTIVYMDVYNNSKPAKFKFISGILIYFYFSIISDFII